MSREITLGQYYPMDLAAHRLGSRTRLFGTTVFIAPLFVADNIWGYVIAMAVPAIVIRLTRVPVRFILGGLEAITILLSISVSSNLFLTDGRILVKFWVSKITFEGARMTFFMSLRFIYLVIGSSAMVLAITSNQLTDDLEKGLGFLERFRVPIHEVTMMMSIALRFTPILVKKADRTMEAQMTEGADSETDNLIQKAKAMIPLLVPLFISVFRRATDLAMAMEAHRYRGDDGHTKMKPLQYRQVDHDTYMIYALYFVVIIASRVYL